MALEVVEELEDGRGFPRAIAAPHGEGGDDSAPFQVREREAGCLVAAAHQRLHGPRVDDGRSREKVDEGVRRRVAAEGRGSRPPFGLESGEVRAEAGGLLRRSSGRGCEEPNPFIHASCPEVSEATDVGARVRGQHEADRRHHPRRDAPSGEDDVNEAAPDAPVPVGEG